MKNPWPLLLPGLILYAVFTLAPIVMTFSGTFVDTGAFGDGWIGLAAWREVFAARRFWFAMLNTVKYTAILVPATMVISIAIAVVLSWSRFKGFGRMAFYVPTITSAVMISIIWRWILAPQGPLTGLTGVLFLGSNPWAFYSIAIMTLSVTLGGPIIYLMASFAIIDKSLYEAARLDGCNGWQEAWHITIPGIAPVLLFLTIERIAGVVQLWQFPYAVTGGGPNYGTTTLMLIAYQEGFRNSRIPNASVISVILMGMVGGLVYLTRVITRRAVL